MAAFGSVTGPSGSASTCALSFAVDGGGFDAVMAATLVAWSVYAGLLVLRRGAALHGRRSAYLVLAGFAVVALTFPITHFAA